MYLTKLMLMVLCTLRLVGVNNLTDSKSDKLRGIHLYPVLIGDSTDGAAVNIGELMI